jgi:hypothetical protein
MCCPLFRFIYDCMHEYSLWESIYAQKACHFIWVSIMHKAEIIKTFLVWVHMNKPLKLSHSLEKVKTCRA